MFIEDSLLVCCCRFTPGLFSDESVFFWQFIKAIKTNQWLLIIYSAILNLFMLMIVRCYHQNYADITRFKY